MYGEGAAVVDPLVNGGAFEEVGRLVSSKQLREEISPGSWNGCAGLVFPGGNPGIRLCKWEIPSHISLT
jgi:hypothetical protein